MVAIVTSRILTRVIRDMSAYCSTFRNRPQTICSCTRRPAVCVNASISPMMHQRPCSSRYTAAKNAGTIGYHPITDILQNTAPKILSTNCFQTVFFMIKTSYISFSNGKADTLPETKRHYNYSILKSLSNRRRPSKNFSSKMPSNCRFEGS